MLVAHTHYSDGAGPALGVSRRGTGRDIRSPRRRDVAPFRRRQGPRRPPKTSGPGGQSFCTVSLSMGHAMVHVIHALTALAGVLLCLASLSPGGTVPPPRAGTIIIGIPRAHFVVLGADRLWTNALPKPGDPSWERRGQQVKIVRHGSLPLAVAAAGLATLGPRQDTMEYIRELITPVDQSSLSFETIVGRLQPALQEQLRAVRDPARRALEANPADAEAKVRLKVARVTLLVAYVTGDRATLGSIQIEDT